MELRTIGIDLGKTVFHLVGLNLRGEVVVRKKFLRKQLLHFTANLQVELIGMEACGGSHFLGRALREQGHEVGLMPAQYVKPYLWANQFPIQLRRLTWAAKMLYARIPVHPTRAARLVLNKRRVLI